MTREERSSGSRMMKELYGSDFAAQVAGRLEELHPELNRVVQDFAYEQVWSRDGLSFREKSLITVAALIAMGREEQTKIHMTGLLQSGGKVEDIENALIHLAVYCGFPAAMNGFAALKQVAATSRNARE